MKKVFWLLIIAATIFISACGRGGGTTADGTTTGGSTADGSTTSGTTTGGTTTVVGTLMGGARQGTPLALSTAMVSTLAGSGTGGAADGIGTAASFSTSPHGITTDGTNLYVADTGNNKIRKIVIATGAVTTLAGSGTSGAADGIGTAASFYYPMGITTDGTNLYVADNYNHKIRKIVIATGAVTTLAGSGTSGSADGIGTAASFHCPAGITTDGTSLYVADVQKIRKILIATGAVTTLAGSSSGGVIIPGAGGVDGTGTAASFEETYGITTDGSSLYVTDSRKIRKISAGTAGGTTTGTAPTVTGISPSSGAAGTSVTITGTNFSTTPANNTVKFNGTTAIVTAATATSLTVTVPSGATNGTISVTTAGGTAMSTGSFTVGGATVSSVIVSKIAADYGHTYALKSDGTVWVLGGPPYVPTVIPGLANVTKLRAKYLHVAALKSDGTVAVWGDNTRGALGNGTRTNSANPIVVPSLAGVVDVSVGYYSTAALKSDGTVMAWGLCCTQIGDSTYSDYLSPRAMTGFTGVVEIVTSVDMLGAVKSDGTLLSLGGFGDLYQMRNAGGGDHLTVLAVPGVAGVTALEYGLALKSDGTVMAWGDNTYGQVGDGTTTKRNTPVVVPGLTGVVAVSASGKHNLALKSNGTVMAWGYNFYGQLGDGTNTQRNTPVAVSGLTGVVAIAAGREHSVALKSDGTIWAWGDNFNWQLGDATVNRSSIPLLVPGF